MSIVHLLHLLKRYSALPLFLLAAACVSTDGDSGLGKGVSVVAFPQGIHTAFSPAWAPGGDQIAFVGYGEGPRQDVVLYDVKTGQSTIILGAEQQFLANSVSWSPDGSRLAVSGGSLTDNSLNGIWTMRHDGTDLRFLTRGDVASWSPDASNLVVVDNYSEVAEAKLVDLETLSETRLNVPAGEELLPFVDVVWAHSGSLIALVVKEAEGGLRRDHLYMVDASTAEVRDAPTFSGPSIGSPSWIGHSSWLVLVAGAGEGRIEFAMPREDCSLSLLPQSLRAHEVDVAQDGGSLAFTRSGLLYIADLRILLGTRLDPTSLSCMSP
jgi:dipeptidyl aminopeptidase/acylaminoacyl peptidase